MPSFTLPQLLGGFTVGGPVERRGRAPGRGRGLRRRRDDGGVRRVQRGRLALRAGAVDAARVPRARAGRHRRARVRPVDDRGGRGGPRGRPGAHRRAGRAARPARPPGDSRCSRAAWSARWRSRSRWTRAASGTAERRRRIASRAGAASARCCSLGGAFVALVGRAGVARASCSAPPAGSRSCSPSWAASASRHRTPVPARAASRAPTPRWPASSLLAPAGARGARRPAGDSTLTWAASPLRLADVRRRSPSLALALPLLAPLVRDPDCPRPRCGRCGRSMRRRRRRERDRATYRGVSFRYPDAPRPALAASTSRSTPGEILLVAGPSGSGKSTLLRAANGLVPHSSGGRFSGDVVAFGRSTRTHQPRELADVVGFVHQDPEAQFVVDHVERDLAFVLENLGHRPAGDAPPGRGGARRARHRAPARPHPDDRSRAASASAARSPARSPPRRPRSCSTSRRRSSTRRAPTTCSPPSAASTPTSAPPSLLAEHRLERAAPLADRARDRRPTASIVDGAGPPAPRSSRTTRAPHRHPPRSPARLGPAAADRARRPPRSRPRRSPTRPTPTPPTRAAAAPHRASVLLERRGPRRRPRRATGARAACRSSVRRGEVVALLGPQRLGQDDAAAGARRAARGAAAGTVARPGPGRVRPAGPEHPAVRADRAGRARRDAAPARSPRPRRGRPTGSTPSGSPRSPTAIRDPRRRRTSTGRDRRGRRRRRRRPAPRRADARHGRTRRARRSSARSTRTPRAAARWCSRPTTSSSRRACASRAVVLGDGDVVASGPARDVLAGSLFAPQVLRVLPPFLTVDEVARAHRPSRSRRDEHRPRHRVRGASAAAERVTTARARSPSTCSPTVLGAAAFLYPFWLPRTALPDEAHARRRAARRRARRRAGRRDDRARGAAGHDERRDGRDPRRALRVRRAWAPARPPRRQRRHALPRRARRRRVRPALRAAARHVHDGRLGGHHRWRSDRGCRSRCSRSGGWARARDSSRRSTARLGAALPRSSCSRRTGGCGASLYGAIMNLWFWPFQRGGALSWHPGLGFARHAAPLLVVLRRDVARAGTRRPRSRTRCSSWSSGVPLLRSLRRFAHRLDPVVELSDHDVS